MSIRQATILLRELSELENLIRQYEEILGESKDNLGPEDILRASYLKQIKINRS